MHVSFQPQDNGDRSGPLASTEAGRHALQVGLASDAGRVRDQNEDATLAWQFMLAQQGQTPLSMGLFIVADGMGGHSQGAQASALACRLAAGHVTQQICLPLLADDEYYEQRPINEVLETSVHLAHGAILHRFPEAGTTLTMALLLGDGIYAAHVGDSRLYLGQPGHLEALTRDHSMAARLIEMGQATSKEITLRRNVLYKAVGQGSMVEPDILYHDLAWGQYLLICCDGLWNVVSDDEMAAIVDAAPTADAACHDLVALANERGGEDNISVIIAAHGWSKRAREKSQKHLPS